VVEHKVLQHTDSLVEWTHSVVLRDTILLQKVVLSISFCGVHASQPAYLEHLSDLQSDLVSFSQSTLSDKLDNLGEILLLLQDLLGSGS
jgi:hypothetical protein